MEKIGNQGGISDTGGHCDTGSPPDSFVPSRGLVVMKFGGTSVKTPARMRRAARRVQHQVRSGWRVVVVVSATGDTTDQIARWLDEIAADGGDTARERDRALATGEDLAAALLAAALLALGIRAVSLRGGEAGLEANGPFGAGELDDLCETRIRSLLESNIVPVVAGFQARRVDGETVTLGRSGSDTTAAFLAGALGASACHIVTDVDGVYDRDPRVDPAACKIPSLAHEDLLALVESGAQVVHPAAARNALRFGTPLHVYDFEAPDNSVDGTFVGSHDQGVTARQRPDGILGSPIPIPAEVPS